MVRNGPWSSLSAWRNAEITRLKTLN